MTWMRVREVDMMEMNGFCGDAAWLDHDRHDGKPKKHDEDTPEDLVRYGRQRDKIFGMVDRHWHRQLRYQLETMYMCYILNCVKKEAPDIMEQAFVSCSIFLGKLPLRVLKSCQAMMRWTSLNWPCISACPTSSNTFKYRLGRCGAPKHSNRDLHPRRQMTGLIARLAWVLMWSDVQWQCIAWFTRGHPPLWLIYWCNGQLQPELDARWWRSAKNIEGPICVLV